MLNPKYNLLYLFLFVFYSCTNQNNHIYVSPLGEKVNIGTKEAPYNTIEKALDKARLIKGNNSTIIHLLEGEYHLSSTLAIDSELSNISIVGDSADKVIIKGSKIIETKWEPFTDNILVSVVDESLDFSQLFINGEKQILARFPNYDENGGYWQGSSADAIDKERIAKWKYPVGGFVHAMHKGRWGGFHYEITSISKDGELNLIGGHQNNRPSAMHPKYRMVENVLEELDNEKEWYLDKENHKLYIWKSDISNLNELKVEVTVLKHLLEVKGTLEKPVKNVKISGVSFQHASRTFMEEYEPLLRSDWTIYRGGALFFQGTENVSITNCEFINLGGNVIFSSGYNRNMEITENHIHDCGASAISFVGDSSAVRSPSFQYNETVNIKEMDTVVGPKNDLYPSGCKVENNLIHRIGRVEKQVAGVQISMAMNIHVKNNSIYDVPRAGINVSEGTWGGHIIEFNDVFNTVLESSDHGSFNSWGRDRFWYPDRNTTKSLVQINPKMPLWDAMYTTIIRNNRFRCDHGWDIDLDDGSSNYKIYNNLCLNRGIKLREGYYRVVKNNIMVNNTFHPHVWFPNSHDIFKNNIVMISYKDIRLQGWGDEIDSNFFSNNTALKITQDKGVDQNSVAGDPLFVNPKEGNFEVMSNSEALKIGFKNFSMDKFGVQKPELKTIAKQPEIPTLDLNLKEIVRQTIKHWLNTKVKQIETLEEKSSYGTHDMSGVIVLEIDHKTTIPITSLLKKGDVLVALGKNRIKGLSHFLKLYKQQESLSSITLTIVRNQKEEVLVYKK